MGAADPLEPLFSRWDRPDTPGCVVGVLRDGVMIQARSYGSANLDHGLPLTPDSVFNTASLSKQFTASCILLLAGQEALSLEDDIRKYIPEFPDFGQTITIRQLANHTAGVRDYLLLMGLAGIDTDTHYFNNQTAMQVICRQDGLDFSPGSEFVYSNSGYILLAEVVRRVSGKSLGQFAREQIFLPLGMEQTFFEEDHTCVIPKRVTSYRPGRGGFHRYLKNFDATGDGGLWTNLNDLVKWDGNFHHPLVGAPDLPTRLLEFPTLGSGMQSNYAFGMARGEYRGLPTIYHGGLVSGFRSQMMRFPGQHFTVIILANVVPFNTTWMAEQVADHFLAEEFTQPHPLQSETTIPPELKESLSGFYQGGSGLNIEIIEQGENLSALALGMQMRLVPTSVRQDEQAIEFHTFEGILSARFRFVRDGLDQPWRMHARAEMHDLGELLQTSLLPQPAIAMEEYCGEYFSQELNASSRILIKNNQPAIQFPSDMTDSLRFIKQDQLVYPGGTLEFQRLPAGRIGGFKLSAGRPRNVSFIRVP